MATDKNQYLWLAADLPENTVITQTGFARNVKINRVPIVDYSSWPAFIYILTGMIAPLFSPFNPVVFIMVPAGAIAWAFQILTLQEPQLPAGCIPGKTYYKYKVTFL